MVRLQCPQGTLSAAQLRAVAGAVAEHGAGFAHVTTRGDLLVQLPDAELAALRASLSESAPEQGASGDSQAVSASAVPGLILAPPIGHSGARPDGVHEQQPGFFWIGVPLAAGRISAEQLRKAADLSERYADGRVRLTPRQGLLLLNVPQEKVVNVLEGLELVGLKPQGSTVRRGLAVCSETDSCVVGWAELSGRAREIIEHLEGQLLLTEPLRIRMAGPACACGASDEEILLAGVGPGPDESGDRYDVRVRGRALAGGVAGEEMKFLLERLLAGWKRGRTPGESLGGFCDRVGHEQVAQQLAQTP